MRMSNNRVAVSSYGRKSMGAVNMLSRRSQNLFTRETFYGKSGDRVTIPGLEETGAKKHCSIK